MQPDWLETFFADFVQKYNLALDALVEEHLEGFVGHAGHQIWVAAHNLMICIDENFEECVDDLFDLVEV